VTVHNSDHKLPTAISSSNLILQSPTLFLPPTSMQWSFADTNSQAVCGDECEDEPDLSPESTEIIQHDDRKPARVLTSSVALEDQQGFPSTFNHPIKLRQKANAGSYGAFPIQHSLYARLCLLFHCVKVVP